MKTPDALPPKGCTIIDRLDGQVNTDHMFLLLFVHIADSGVTVMCLRHSLKPWANMVTTSLWSSRSCWTSLQNRASTSWSSICNQRSNSSINLDVDLNPLRITIVNVVSHKTCDAFPRIPAVTHRTSSPYLKKTICVVSNFTNKGHVWNKSLLETNQTVRTFYTKQNILTHSLLSNLNVLLAMKQKFSNYRAPA